jgi:antitoxin (DNA-binding transcriptional repressor) of toxin-antitoxin stability system
MHVTDQNRVPADIAAAAAASEYWNKNNRSIKRVIENRPVESISGQAV